MASAEDVKKLASLARLDIPEDKLAAFAAEFDGILAYVGQLEKLPIDVSNTPAVATIHNAFRADGEPHASGAFTEKITAQFPDRDGDSLKVKQIISHD
jgi:aspartyl-tRNA(Asn)/glutamyl-tRNA(Gln) amidotransferase subunit C